LLRGEHKAQKRSSRGRKNSESSQLGTHSFVLLMVELRPYVLGANSRNTEGRKS